MDRDNIKFLDLYIYIERNQIQTKPFFKEVNANSFLNFRSRHLQKWKTNMPYGQMVRIKCNCSNKSICEDQMKVLANRLKVKKSQRRKKSVRKTLISPSLQNTQAMDIKRTLNKNWRILDSDPHLSSTIGKKPTVIFCKSKTLKEILASSYPLCNGKGDKHLYFNYVQTTRANNNKLILLMIKV